MDRVFTVVILVMMTYSRHSTVGTTVTETKIWNRPCFPRLPSEKIPFENETGIQLEIKAYNRLHTQASTALNTFNSMKDKWCYFAFHLSFQDLALKWLWQPQKQYLPDWRTVGKTPYLPFAFEGKYADRVQNLQDVYLWLQKLLMGLEQAVSDAFKFGEPLANRLADLLVEHQLLLCHFDKLMFQLGYEKLPNPPDDLMGILDRKLSTHNIRRSREFNILRDFENIVEYLKAALKHYEHHAKNNH